MQYFPVKVILNVPNFEPGNLTLVGRIESKYDSAPNEIVEGNYYLYLYSLENTENGGTKLKYIVPTNQIALIEYI